MKQQLLIPDGYGIFDEDGKVFGGAVWLADAIRRAQLEARIHVGKRFVVKTLPLAQFGSEIYIAVLERADTGAGEGHT